MNAKMAVIAAAVTFVGGLAAAGCGPDQPNASAQPSTTTATSSQTATTPQTPTRSQRPSTPQQAPQPSDGAGADGMQPGEAALAAKVGNNGDLYTMVSLPSGNTTASEEGATISGQQISFWIYKGGKWTTNGGCPLPSTSTQDELKVTGGYVTGDTDAVFIVQGRFSGDGTADTVAYAATESNWGALKPANKELVANPGIGVDSDGNGLFEDIAVVNGLLKTSQCSSTLPSASCGGDKTAQKFWKIGASDTQGATDSEYVLDHTAGLPE